MEPIAENSASLNTDSNDTLNVTSSVETITSNVEQNITCIKSVESIESKEDEKIDVKFGTNDNESEEEEIEQKEDLSKYTVLDADNLDEDDPLDGQKYCLFSFMSPEGIMNCNVRAFKFRGAFPTIEAAQKYAEKLEKSDKYFKIFAGESGKWLDFDPPASRVEKEMSSNKEHQKILDAQAKQRMTKINALAGKHKQLVDKKEKGKGERIEEYKKAGAASDALDKKRAKSQQEPEKQEKEDKRNVIHVNPRDRALDATKERMRKKLAEKQNKEKVNSIGQQEVSNRVDVVSNTSDVNTDINQKVKVVNSASQDLADKKAKLEKAEKNIENIKRLMANRKNDDK